MGPPPGAHGPSALKGGGKRGAPTTLLGAWGGPGRFGGGPTRGLTELLVGQELEDVPWAPVEGEAEGLRGPPHAGHEVGVPIHWGGGERGQRGG